MPNIANVLSGDFSDAAPPVPPPIGTYLMVVSKTPSQKQYDGNDGASTIVDFPLAIVQAQDDVDLDGYTGKLEGRVVNHSFWLHHDERLANDKYFLKKFIEDHLGIEVGNGSIEQALSKSVGARCLAKLGIRMDKDNPERAYSRIISTSAA